MAKVKLHPVKEQLLRLELQAQQLQDQVDVLLVVLAWLLERQPGDAGLHFLSRQANALEETPDHEEEVATLDSLRELVALLRDGSKKPPAART